MSSGDCASQQVGQESPWISVAGARASETSSGRQGSQGSLSVGFDGLLWPDWGLARKKLQKRAKVGILREMLITVIVIK